MDIGTCDGYRRRTSARVAHRPSKWRAPRRGVRTIAAVIVDPNISGHCLSPG